MIYLDESTVKVGGVILPGLFRSMEIVGGALIEEQTIEGSSKKPKQATGYEDSKVTLELMLQEGPKLTIIEKLDIIQSLFKSKGQDKPIAHDIVSEHTVSRGISKVLFKKLTTKDTNKADELLVTIELWEYVPTLVSAVKVTTKVNFSGTTASTTTTEKLEPKVYSELDQKYKDYLTSRSESSYNKKMRTYLESRAVADKKKDQAYKTAARDNAQTAAYKNKVMAIPV